VLFLFVAVALYQRRRWTLGSVAFSAGVSVKMSLLLAVPGLLMVLGQAMHSRRSVVQVNIMALVQVSEMTLATKGVSDFCRIAISSIPIHSSE